jgi:hypothetical protein
MAELYLHFHIRLNGAVLNKAQRIVIFAFHSTGVVTGHSGPHMDGVSSDEQEPLGSVLLS